MDKHRVILRRSKVVRSLIARKMLMAILRVGHSRSGRKDSGAVSVGHGYTHGSRAPPLRHPLTWPTLSRTSRLRSPVRLLAWPTPSRTSRLRSPAPPLRHPSPWPRTSRPTLSSWPRVSATPRSKRPLSSRARHSISRTSCTAGRKSPTTRRPPPPTCGSRRAQGGRRVSRRPRPRRAPRRARICGAPPRR